VQFGCNVPFPFQYPRYVSLTAPFPADTLSAMPESTKKYLVILVYLALALSTIAVFWQVRNFEFIVYDDNFYVTDNQHVLNGLTPDNIVWAFTTGHAANWHPLTWLSLMLDCQLFGPNPGRIHLVNLLMHLANTLLVFAILKKMTDSLWPSAFVAAAFALHPMHVESVAWIAERKDVLSTLFWLLTLAAYVGYVRRSTVFRYIVTLVIFAMGLLAKPMLVTLPFVLLLLDYWPLKRFSIADSRLPIEKNPKSKIKKLKFAQFSTEPQRSFGYLILEKLPLFILSAVSSVITFLVQRSGGVVIDINVLSLEGRIGNAFLSYARYMGKMLWPQNLAVFYPFDAGGFSLWQIVLCAVLLLVISVFVIRFGKKQKYLPVGWFWFAGTLIPVIGIVQVGSQSLADRYTYIPYIGLFIMFAWGLPELLSKWPYRRIALGISPVVVLTVLGICTYRQVSYWNNSDTLFSHALEVTQNNYLAHFNLADDLRKHGKTTLAIEHLTKALQIIPNYADAILTLGCALSDQGNAAQAVEYFQKMIQLKPGSGHAAYAYYNLGITLQKQGRLTDAIADFTLAVQLRPDFAEARYNRANVLVLQGRLNEALDQFREVLRLRPNWPESMNDIAWLMATHPELKNRDVNEAVRLARRACELTNYSSPFQLGTLAAAYASVGRFSDAVDTAHKALSLADTTGQPQFKDALRYHLTFYTQGKPYIEAPQTPPSNPNKP
jgi:tetratricopeptide (TPR) repeat protein